MSWARREPVAGDTGRLGRGSWRRRFRGQLCLLVLVAAALVLAAGCTTSVSGEGRAASSSGTAIPGDPNGGDRTGTPPAGGADVRSCPRVVDTAARLAYDCIDRSFVEIPLPPDPSFADGSVRMATYTESTWLAGQQSGALSLTGATAQFVALLLASQQAADNYGDNPTSQARLGIDLPGLGESAYRIDMLVTLDPVAAQQRGLAVRSERLCVVVVEVDTDVYSAMTISIPDTRQDLWAGYDAVVASIATL